MLLKFIVRREGSLSDIYALHFKHEQLKEEAIRLLKLSCDYWVPSDMGGVKITAWTQLAFIFEVNTNKEEDNFSIRTVNPSPSIPRIYSIDEVE